LWKTALPWPAFFGIRFPKARSPLCFSRSCVKFFLGLLVADSACLVLDPPKRLSLLHVWLPFSGFLARFFLSRLFFEYAFRPLSCLPLQDSRGSFSTRLSPVFSHAPLSTRVLFVDIFNFFHCFFLHKRDISCRRNFIGSFSVLGLKPIQSFLFHCSGRFGFLGGFCPPPVTNLCAAPFPLRLLNYPLRGIGRLALLPKFTWVFAPGTESYIRGSRCLFRWAGSCA